MSVSAQSLSSPEVAAPARGLPAALEVLVVAAVFVGTMFASLMFQLVLGTQIALISASCSSRYSSVCAGKPGASWE